MRHDFDEIIDRRGGDSRKWNTFSSEILPLWVADMDFKSPAPLVQALAQRAQHGVFGYTAFDARVEEATAFWLSSRHGWAVSPDQVAFSPSVECSLTMMVDVFTAPGDNIMFLTPAYPPFFSTTKNKGRNVLGSPLLLTEDQDGNPRFAIDFDDLERKMSLPRTRMLILCSPNNPTGRLWSRAELLRLGELCLKHNLLVVADEIHCDFAFAGKHLPFADLSPELAHITLSAISPSKTFNTAALQVSAVISLNRHLLARFASAIAKAGLEPPALGVMALHIAYTQCSYYADQVAAYIRANQEYAVAFINREIPGLKAYLPEAAYLLWLNCRQLAERLSPGAADAVRQNALMEFFLQKARVALNSGLDYGLEGLGFMRLNPAGPRSLLQEGLHRMKSAVAALA